MKKQKTFFKRVALLSFALITLFVIMFVSAYHSDLKPLDSFTMCSDGDYYSETTYYLTEELFNQRNGQNQKSAAGKKLTAEDKGEFVLAAEKKVWVAEKYNGDGNPKDSRLLKKSEVEAYKRDSLNENSDTLRTSATHSLGTDKESYYALSIMLTADYYADSDWYKVSGFSMWEKNYSSNDNKYIAEKGYEDYVGFTWGGEGTIQGSDYNMRGYFSDFVNNQSYNKPLSVSRCLTNSFSGVVWQFIEKNQDGKSLTQGSSYVTLTKVGELQNKMTSVRFTYIHTYDIVKGTVSINVGAGGLAGGISLSSAEKQWQIEIDLSGIEY